MVDRNFGSAGDKVVIEEALFGEEASFTVLTDGVSCLPFVSSQDHKMSLDGDQGKNTGGMGAYSPAPVMTSELSEQVMNTIVQPAISAMASEGAYLQGHFICWVDDYRSGPKSDRV